MFFFHLNIPASHLLRLGQRLVAVVEVDLVVVRHESNLLTLKGAGHEMHKFCLKVCKTSVPAPLVFLIF